MRFIPSCLFIAVKCSFYVELRGMFLWKCQASRCQHWQSVIELRWSNKKVSSELRNKFAVKILISYNNWFLDTYMLLTGLVLLDHTKFLANYPVQENSMQHFPEMSAQQSHVPWWFTGCEWRNDFQVFWRRKKAPDRRVMEPIQPSSVNQFDSIGFIDRSTISLNYSMDTNTDIPRARGSARKKHPSPWGPRI